MSVFERKFLMILLISLLPVLILGAPKKFNLKNDINSENLLEEIKVESETNPNQDLWFSVDKGYHLIGSLICTTGISNSCNRFTDIKKDKSLQIGIGFTFALGLGKELWDGQQSDNIFSWKDLTADVLGILIGSMLMQVD